MLDVIAFVVAAIIVSILFAYSVVQTLRNRSIATQLFQALLDKAAVEDQLVTILSDRALVEIEKSDGFLKFISESRDAAFEYIEGLQDALVAYQNAINSNNELEISKTRELLFSFLPKSDDSKII